MYKNKKTHVSIWDIAKQNSNIYKSNKDKFDELARSNREDPDMYKKIIGQELQKNGLDPIFNKSNYEKFVENSGKELPETKN
jgi:hypothetical protein